ncbi:hypothetical protein HMPREF0305_12409 [Corynebacterium pseudogenitalium ATCC 33035]|uniref:DNA helicase DnaB-like N-terminal domain-containing protein n=2 Tax=Corynebacterium pseudogenitalium TaxID=38303 RepID=E2S7A7_9CORY|nr:hypothetical protein HMPREF0305_12409 [Corynebacterium pseudogenitalium ATCC 33035]
MSHDTPHIADRADNDPREDPEALLIAALLWNRGTTQAINLTQTLTPADFYSTDYAVIFATISQQLKSGRPYDGPDPRAVDTSGGQARTSRRARQESTSDTVGRFEKEVQIPSWKQSINQTIVACPGCFSKIPIPHPTHKELTRSTVS